MSKICYSRNTKPCAQRLRREATPQENHLWYDFLRSYPMQFRRQKQIDRFIVDFYCSQAKLVVEIDGGQHYTDDGLQRDAERTAYLESYGLEVLRFTNLDVERNFTGVCQSIENKVKHRTRNGRLDC